MIQTIALASPKIAQPSPLPLRRIRYVDPGTGRRPVFLTNDFTLPALTIAHFYLQGMAAGRPARQVDLAAPANQSFLRHLRERGEAAGLDHGRYFRGRRAPDEAAWLTAEPSHTSPRLSVTPFEKMSSGEALAPARGLVAEGEGWNESLLFNR